jgi:hypothetical protein
VYFVLAEFTSQLLQLCLDLRDGHLHSNPRAFARLGQPTLALRLDGAPLDAEVLRDHTLEAGRGLCRERGGGIDLRYMHA